MTETEWLAALPEQFRERPEMAYMRDVAGLPRVLLLGDSISMSYTVPVRRLLAGVANVHRAPDNCRSTRQSVAELDRYLGNGDWRDWQVIHCNWGIHDITRKDAAGNVVEVGEGPQQVPIDEYRANLEQLFERLAATDARLVWATSTPAQEGTRARAPRDIERYNAVAAEVVAARKVAVNDLYALALPRLTELQPPRNVHFTPEGAELLAGQVAAAIRAALAGA